jgi:outer membrane murein-binding lipoprotein Lpp
MGMAAQVQTQSPYVPVTVVKAYIKSFQGNMAAASEYARCGYITLDNAVKGELRDTNLNALLWAVIRRRLSRKTLDEAMTRHEQQQHAALVAAEEEKEQGAEKVQKSEPLTIVALHDAMPEQEVMATEPERICADCGDMKAATAFQKHSSGQRLTICKPCNGKRTHGRRQQAQATTPVVEEVIVPEPTAVDVLLSTRLLQLAVDADALEKQVAAAGGASAAKVEELEAEVTTLRTLVTQMATDNGELQERLAAARTQQFDKADLLAQVADLTGHVASLTKENTKLWARLDALAAEATTANKQGRAA